jgi:hypothetical protein
MKLIALLATVLALQAASFAARSTEAATLPAFGNWV